MDILVSIIGGSVGAAFVAGVFGLIQWGLTRNAQKEDKANAESAAVCHARGEEIRQLKEKVEVGLLADRTILYDRIKLLAKSYIARGYITVEELEDLNLMHAVYHDKDKLDGNGFLDNIMHTVNHTLEVRVN